MTVYLQGGKTVYLQGGICTNYSMYRGQAECIQRMYIQYFMYGSRLKKKEAFSSSLR